MGTNMKIKMAASLLLVCASSAVAAPSLATADPVYLAVAVGYQASGTPQGIPYVGATPAEAKEQALWNCKTRLVACAPGKTSTQCLGIAVGVGRWEIAEGPDKNAAKINARDLLAEIAGGVPLPDNPNGLDPIVKASCSWDPSWS